MKKTILIPFLLLALVSFSQSEYEKKYFNSSYVDTFKNESIVLGRCMDEHTYEAYGVNDYKVTVVFRAHYVLKDISALNYFSTLYKNEDMKKYSLTQIKPDGKKNVIYEYVNNNYPIDGYDTPEDEDNKKKNEEIPLENLEIGDIIDYRYEYTYTTTTKNTRKVLLKNGKFDKVVTDVPNNHPYKFLISKNNFLKESYAIASRVFVIHAPNELKLNQKSINTNFKFTTVSNGKSNTHECIIALVTPYKSEDFSHPYLHYPVVKYTLVQTNAAKAEFFPYQFTNENVSHADIAALGTKLYMDKKFVSKFLYYLNTQNSTEAFYNADLNKFFSSFLKTFTKKDKDKLTKLNKLHEYLTNEDELNKFPFGEISTAVILARFCDKLGIKYKMIACLHKYDGKWSEVVSPYEITWGLYIPNKEKDIYITTYEKKSNIYQRFGSLTGQDIIVFDPKSPKNPHTIMQYPEIPANDNLYEQTGEITISDDTAYDYTFVNTYKLKGSSKFSLSSYIQNQFDHEKLRTPYKFFGLVNYNDLYNWKEFTSNEEWFDEYKRVDSFYTKYYKDYYNNMMLAFLYTEYDFTDITMDSNRVFEENEYKDDESQDYGFKIVFKAKGVLEKGFNDSIKILNLGMIMTGQYNISNYKVEERFCDVFNSNLKTIKWNNSVEIPKGYSCVNLADFNVNFENEAGIFKTTAVIEDGKIIFSIEKTYKTHFLPKEKWMEMVNFLQTAEAMYMKKLLLQKN